MSYMGDLEKMFEIMIKAWGYVSLGPGYNLLVRSKQALNVETIRS